MLLVLWIHDLPKVSGLGSLLDALKCLMWVARWHVNEGKIDFAIVEWIFENEIHPDHRKSPFLKVRLWCFVNQHPELVLPHLEAPELDGRDHDAQAQQRSPYRIMSKWLPNSHAFTIDRDANQPVTNPLEIGYCRMLELRVAVWADDKQVAWVMADLWVKMVYFKVRSAIPFFEAKRTKLTPPIM